jgi:beta-glucanase (GH16 family)
MNYESVKRPTSVRSLSLLQSGNKLLATPVNLFGYHLTFDAEMTTSADMAQFTNAYANGDRRLYANHEEEYYVDYNATDPANPYKFNNGALNITATPTPAGGQPYTSGMLDTINSFSQNQGYFEMRAKTPNAQGFWPAFWMLAPAYQPEIDMLEQPNNSGSDSKYWAAINTPELFTAGFNDTGVSLSQGYHSYGFLWDQYSIQFTFDGNLIGFAHVTPASMASVKMYLLANLAVGDQYSWPGAPLPGASATYSIDYIRAYSLDPSAPAVPMEQISSPDGVDTSPKLGTPISIGTGPDSFVFLLAEDAYNGDAQFTITIDGVQQGGVFTTTALHNNGQSQKITVNGTFGTGAHNAAVTFLNDAYGGSGLDRNLYVNGISYNGAGLAPSNASLLSNGTATFAIAAAVPDVVVGTGPDSFEFKISEDAYAGDAQYTISIDGVQQGGILTAAASHTSGVDQKVTVNGTFGTGPHTATVNFLNDAGGPNGGDRNLYVDAANYNGSTLTPTSAPLYSNGPVNFSSGTASGTSVVGTGPDNFMFGMSEDPNAGDAQFTIAVDGVQQGGVMTTSALHASGQSQQFQVNGSFGAGTHTAVVTFLNDLYGPNGQDRNLYIDSASFDGATLTPGSGALYSNGSMSFVRPANDSLTVNLAEDAYLGDAKAEISIDNQLLATVTVTALNSGTPQPFNFVGNFGSGPHTVGVSFINDASGSGGDRNLYVKGISYDGVSHPDATASLYFNTMANFNV